MFCFCVRICQCLCGWLAGCYHIVCNVHQKQGVMGFFMVFSRFLSCGFRFIQESFAGSCHAPSKDLYVDKTDRSNFILSVLHGLVIAPITQPTLCYSELTTCQALCLLTTGMALLHGMHTWDYHNHVQCAFLSLISLIATYTCSCMRAILMRNILLPNLDVQSMDCYLNLCQGFLLLRYNIIIVLHSYYIGAVLGFKLTNELAINSNLNGMRRLSGATLKQQV